MYICQLNRNVDAVSERPEYQGLTVPGQHPSTPESGVPAHQGIEPGFNDETVTADVTSVTLEDEDMTEHQYDRPHVSVVKFTVD